MERNRPLGYFSEITKIYIDILPNMLYIFIPVRVMIQLTA